MGQSFVGVGDRMLQSALRPSGVGGLWGSSLGGVQRHILHLFIKIFLAYLSLLKPLQQPGVVQELLQVLILLIIIGALKPSDWTKRLVLFVN